jgi:hypothetical protein
VAQFLPGARPNRQGVSRKAVVHEHSVCKALAAIDVAELRYGLAFGSSVEEIADFLQRGVDDVRQQIEVQVHKIHKTAKESWLALRATAVKRDPLAATTQMAPPTADYETRRLQIALAMIKQEIELIRLFTEAHRLRQQINRNDLQQDHAYAR